jgi:hypothetical protein
VRVPGCGVEQVLLVVGSRTAGGFGVEQALGGRAATGGRGSGDLVVDAGDDIATAVKVDGRGKRVKGLELYTGRRMGTGRRGRFWVAVVKKAVEVLAGLVTVVDPGSNPTAAGVRVTAGWDGAEGYIGTRTQVVLGGGAG